MRQRQDGAARRRDSRGDNSPAAVPLGEVAVLVGGPVWDRLRDSACREGLAAGCLHSDGGVVLKIGQQISVAVKLYGSEGVEPM